ncbi:MAG: hypothetical protein WCE94_00415 [Candidatus Methanoperedens sp.]
MKTMVLDAKIPAQVRIEITTGMCLLIKNTIIEQGDYPASRLLISPMISVLERLNDFGFTNLPIF